VARIRTIKPDLWQDEDLAEVSEPALLLAIGLLNHADDEGYFKAHPGLIKAAIFPLREPSLSIHGMLSELSSAGYLRLFEGYNGKQYGHIVGFAKHQKINRPTPSKIRELDGLNDYSVSDHGGFTPGSGTGNREQGSKHTAPQAAQDESGEERYLTKRKRELKPPHLGRFEKFWEAFDYRRGKAEAADAWLDLKPDADTAEAIICGAEAEARARPAVLDAGRTPKMAQGWLSGRRWEDEDLAAGNEKPWHETATGIRAKAQELGIEEQDGEPVFALKQRVMQAAGGETWTA